MHALKQSEDPFVRFLGKAEAVVLEPKPHVSVIHLAPNTNARLFARLDKFHGVVQQVGDALTQVGLVSAGWLERSLNFDFRSGRLKLRPFVNDLADQLFNIDCPQFNFLPGYTAVSEDIANQAVESTGRADGFL